MADNLKQKIRPGSIELDPEDSAIIVHFDTITTDVTALGDDGKPAIVAREPGQRRVLLKTFRPDSNVSKFASGIIEKCNLIHPSKQAYIEDLLQQLADRLASELQMQEKMTTQNTQRDTRSPPFVSIAPPSTSGSSRGATSSSSSSSSGHSAVGQGNPQFSNTAPARPASRAGTGSGSADISTTWNSNMRAPRTAAQGSSSGASSPGPYSSQPASPTLAPDYQNRTAHTQATLAATAPSVITMHTRQASSPDSPNRPMDFDATVSSAHSGMSSERERDRDRDRDQSGNSAQRPASRARPGSAATRKTGHSGSGAASPTRPPRPVKSAVKASMKKLDSYLEKLYEEDIEQKLAGTAALLQLVQDPANLQHFIENETIIPALARVLTEDRKKSSDLVLNILETFFHFSRFSQLHPLLLQNKLGDTSMRIIDLELKRFDVWHREGTLALNGKLLEKQERVLYVCFFILLNLAEDPKIEVKMVSRKINELLIKVLQHDSADRSYLDEQLLPLIVTFLKKLSIFAENKAEMAQQSIVSQLTPLLHEESPPHLQAVVLRLLYNLSFDPSLRKEIIRTGLVPVFARVLVDNEHARLHAVRVLYNISTDDELSPATRQALAGVAPTIMQLVIGCPQTQVDVELVGLALNLSLDERNAQAMSGNDLLHLVIKRVHQTHDALLMKFVRNLSEHAALQPAFARFVHELAGMVLRAPTHDFLVEALACLGNIAHPDVLFSELISRHGLLDFIMKLLTPGFAEDDVVLEAVIVIGTLAIDPASAPMMANLRLIRLLFDVMNAKHQDDDIVMQVLFTFFKLLLHDITRKAVVSHAQISTAFLELVADPNTHIRRLAYMCLDLTMEAEDAFSEQVRIKRFEAYNTEWLQFVQRGAHLRPHTDSPHQVRLKFPEHDGQSDADDASDDHHGMAGLEADDDHDESVHSMASALSDDADQY